MNRPKRRQAQSGRPVDVLNEWRSRPGNEARYQAACARYRASAKGRRKRRETNRRHHRKCRLELSDSYVRTQLHLKFPSVPAPGFPDALVAAKREELRLKRKLGISHGAHKTPLKTRIYMREYMRRYKKNQKTKGTDEKSQLPPPNPQGPAKPEASARSACRELRRLVSESRIA